MRDPTNGGGTLQCDRYKTIGGVASVERGLFFNRRTPITARLEYPLPGLPDPGKALEVADGVYWVRMPLPFALDHINLWLLRDGNGWTIVDTGFGIDVTKKLWDQVLAEYLDGRPVNRVIVTHLHPDHIGLAAWLAERFSVEVWMTQGEFTTAHLHWDTVGALQDKVVDLYRWHGLDEARLASVAGRGSMYRRSIPALPSMFRRIADDESFVIDGRAWRVIVGRGHSPEHASLYCESSGVLISGDMVLPKITTNVSIVPYEPEGNPLALFLQSLKRFATLPHDTLVLPSHGLVFYGLRERLEDLAQHHEERFDLVADACQAPQTAAALLGQLFKRQLDAHQLGFAMGEAIAHLNYMMYAKRLERTKDPDGVYRFARPSAA